MTKNREEIIQDQLFLVINTIQANIHSLDSLKDKILEIKFEDGRSLKPETVDLAIEILQKEIETTQFGTQYKDRYKAIVKTLNEAVLPEIEVKNVKTRPLEVIKEKTEGLSLGKQVRKIPKNNLDKAGSQKFNRDLMQKKIILRGSKRLKDSRADIFFEFLTLSIFRSPNIPKFRLHRDDSIKNGLTGISTFIDNFNTIYDYSPPDRLDLLPGAQGFGEFFAITTLLGDFDINSGNIGIRIDKNNNKYFAKIDFGRGLSYCEIYDWETKKFENHPSGRSASAAKQKMLGMHSKYPDEFPFFQETNFHGADFACEVYNTTLQFNETKIRNSLNRALDILMSEQAFKEKALEIENIKKEILKRLGFKTKEKDGEEEQISKENIVNKIIEYINQNKNELQQIAIDEAKEICKKKESIKDIEKIANEIPEAFIQTLKKAIEKNDLESLHYYASNINLNNNVKKIQTQQAEEQLSLFYAIKARDHIQIYEAMKLGHKLTEEQQTQLENEINARKEAINETKEIAKVRKRSNTLEKIKPRKKPKRKNQR